MTERLRARAHARPGTALSPREVETLRFAARGMDLDLVGRAMGISTNTVKNHLSNAYNRLDVSGLIGALNAVGWIAVELPAVLRAALPASDVDEIESRLRRAA